MHNYRDIREIIEDIAAIRRGLETAEKIRTEKAPVEHSVTIVTQRIVQVAALIGAATLLMVEIITGGFNTQLILSSARNQWLLYFGISNMAIMLMVMIAALYFIIRRAARVTEIDFKSYVADNFSYLRNFSLLCDLLIKFSILSLVLVARQPEWFAGLLSLFTADYLLQGRFFTIPLRLSLILGVGALIVAAAQYYFSLADLHWSLLLFVVVSGISVGFTYRGSSTSLTAKIA